MDSMESKLIEVEICFSSVSRGEAIRRVLRLLLQKCREVACDSLAGMWGLDKYVE